MGLTFDLKYLFQAHSNGVIPKFVCTLEAPSPKPVPTPQGCDLVGLDVPWQWDFL